MIFFKCGQTYIYIKIDNGGTKTILGPARALRARVQEQESEENRANWAFRPIMEQLVGKGLERSKGTSSIAQ